MTGKPHIDIQHIITQYTFLTPIDTFNVSALYVI